MSYNEMYNDGYEDARKKYRRVLIDLYFQVNDYLLGDEPCDMNQLRTTMREARTLIIEDE